MKQRVWVPCRCSTGGDDQHTAPSPDAQQQPEQHRPRRAAVLRGASLAALACLLAGRAADAADVRVGEVAHSESEWQQLLTEDQYRVLRQSGTEPRFSSPLVEVRGLTEGLA